MNNRYSLLMPPLSILIFFSIVIPVRARAQSDSIDDNSFKKWYQHNNPSLEYSYDALKQIHNYSGNWDLDNDGQADQVFFIGTGGAHLYFYLRIILSTNRKTQNFPFLETDVPFLGTDSITLSPNFNPAYSKVHFAVYNNSYPKTKALFLRLDEAVFHTEKKVFKKKGITTNTVVLFFKNGRPVLINSKK